MRFVNTSAAESTCAAPVAAQSDSIAPASILVRLDYPAIVSTRIKPNIPIRGWVFIPPALEPKLKHKDQYPLELEALVERADDESEKNPLVAGVRLSAAAAPQEDGDRPGRTVRLNPHPVRYSDLASGVSGLRLEFDGAIDLSATVSGDPRRDKFRLLVCCRLDGLIACSNPATVCLVRSDALTEPRGGFIHIEPPELTAPFIHLRGWAFAAGDPVEAATITVGGRAAGRAQFNIPSPEEAGLFPDCAEAEQCIFEGVISAAELAAGGFDLSDQLLISAQIEFKSGRKLALHSFAVKFRPQTSRDEEISGEIERVSTAATGELQISGWLLNPRYGRIDLRFSTLRGNIPLPPEQSRIVRRFEREDIDGRFPLLTDGRSGFEICVTPKIFGRAPGRISLEAVDSATGRAVRLGPQWLEHGIWAEAAKSRNAALDKLLDPVSIGASKLLGLPTWPRVNVPPQRGCAGRRLVFALHNLSAVEGAPKVIFEIIKSLRTTSATPPEVLVVCGKGGALESELQALGCAVEKVSELDWGHQTWLRYSRGLEIAAEIFDRFSPGLAFAGVSDCFWAVDLAKRRGIPAVWCIQEGAHPYSKYPDFDPRLRTRYLAALNSADRLLFVSETVRRLYQGVVPPERTGVVINGIDLDSIDAARSRLSREDARKSLGLEPADFSLVIVGTTTHRKGQDIFLREAAELKRLLAQSSRSLRCFIVGARQCDFLFTLQAEAARLGLSGTVTFVDEQPDIAAYYIAADAAAICSREEASPLVSLEAFAYGVPLVSTQVQGLAEQVTDGETGLIFDPQTKGDMARKVLRLANSPELRQQLAVLARTSVENKFSMRANIRGYEKEVRTVLEPDPVLDN